MSFFQPGLSDQNIMFAFTLLGVFFLIHLLPDVSWFTPGSARRFKILGWVVLFGATYYGFRLRIWPIAVGGVGLVWLIFAATAISGG